jgi:hypothetical protein
VAAVYLCALPLGWVSFVGCAVTLLPGMRVATPVFVVLFVLAGFTLAAIAMYLLAREPGLAASEGRGLFVSSWPLPKGWRASWGRVMLGKEIPYAKQAFQQAG